jgi:hypothetical protein
MKIFCLGLSKTGTNSLTSALNILGFRAVHWHYTRKVFDYHDDGIKIHYDKFIDYDAFADTPIARIYPELDKRFPGSKFILTIRDGSKWAESFRSQFENGISDEFEARLHMDLYGTDSYDHDLCVAAFDKHTRNIKQYFEGREEDLLIINLTEGDGWEKLCKFLGKAVPDVEFPVRYKKQERDLNYRLRKLIRGPQKIPEYIMNRIRRLIEG